MLIRYAAGGKGGRAPGTTEHQIALIAYAAGGKGGPPPC
jgi:hypothetical protein